MTHDTHRPLISGREPALFEVVNPGGGGPALVCCDHAGARIPAQMNHLGLRREHLNLHIASDLGARQVSLHLSRLLDAPLLLANYSRLVIDLNRHLDDPTLIPEVSDGVIIPGNAELSAGHRRQRIYEMFMPYHRRYRELVDDKQAKFANPRIIAVHSFAPEIQGVKRPWDIGLLWEEHRDLAQSIIANLSENEGLCIGRNQPYHARDPLGYAMVVHAQARDVEMALIEVRQDRIQSRAGQAWAADVLYRALSPLLDDSPAV